MQLRSTPFSMRRSYSTPMSSNKMRAALGRTILFDGLDSGILHSNLYLESVMCKTLIEMHHLKISFNENDVEDMFSRIIGMRFSTIAMIEKWIFEKLQVTKKSLPNFVLQESEINDEILFGNADVDFVLDGTFGKGVLKKQHYDFSISYLKTNDHQMFITDAHWN